jgi:hypothetical protein
MGKQNIIQYMHNIYVLQKKLSNQQVELLVLLINKILLICIVLYFESDVRAVYLSSG